MEFELQVGASSADIREVVNVLVTGETQELAGNGACSAAVTLHGRKRIKSPSWEMGKDYTQQFVVSLRGFPCL